MSPLEIFTLGKGLWSLYEKIDEHFDYREPQENIQENSMGYTWNRHGNSNCKPMDCPCDFHGWTNGYSPWL